MLSTLHHDHNYRYVHIPLNFSLPVTELIVIELTERDCCADIGHAEDFTKKVAPAALLGAHRRQLARLMSSPEEQQLSLLLRQMVGPQSPANEGTLGGCQPVHNLIRWLFRGPSASAQCSPCGHYVQALCHSGH